MLWIKLLLNTIIILLIQLKSNEKNNEYNSKSSAIKAANEKKNAADSKLQELKDKKSGIEDNIASVTTELGKYE